MTGYKALVLDSLDKYIIVLLGLVMCASAGVLTEQVFTGEGVHLFFPALWPLLFLLSGLACFNFAINPTCKVAYSLSGSLTAGAFFARAVQFTYLMADPTDTLPWEHVAMDVLGYLTATALVILSWRRLIRRAPHDHTVDHARRRWSG